MKPSNLALKSSAALFCLLVCGAGVLVVLERAGGEPTRPAQTYIVGLSSSLSAAAGGLRERSAVWADQAEDFLQIVLGNVCRLAHAEVQGTYRTKDYKLLSKAGLDRKPWVWQLSTEAIVSRLKSDPWVESVDLRWEFFPLSLIAVVQEKEPWMIAEMGADTWLVSRSGALIENLSTVQDPELIIESSELPRIDGITPDGDAGAPNARFLYAVRVLKLIDAAGGMPFDAERYSILPDGSLAVQPKEIGEAPQVLLRIENFTEAKDALERLQLTLSDLARRGESAKTLDLRFSNQVVVTPLVAEADRPVSAPRKGRG